MRTPKRPIMQAAAATEKYADKRYQTNRTPSSLYFSEPSHSDSVSHRRDFQRVRSCKAAARLRKVPQRARARVAVLEYGEIIRGKVLLEEEQGLILCGKETKPSHLNWRSWMRSNCNLGIRDKKSRQRTLNLPATGLRLSAYPAKRVWKL